MHNLTIIELEAIKVIESVDSISITNAGISLAMYTITHFKHYHRVLWLIYNRINECLTSL